MPRRFAPRNDVNNCVIAMSYTSLPPRNDVLFRHCEPRSGVAIHIPGDIMKSYIYIVFNKRNGTLYTGVTSNLKKRIYEHKNKVYDSFTSKYDVNKLGYYEEYNDIKQAIEREKQIKAGNRKKKMSLIESINPSWEDLTYLL